MRCEHYYFNKLPIMILAFSLLTGCASQIMQRYVGQPVQSVMLDYGPPQNAFDLPDSTRVFQWVKGESYTTPLQVNTYGSNGANLYGNTASGWATTRSTITGGQTINSSCVYSLYTKWSDAHHSYIVTGFKNQDCFVSRA